MCFSALVSERLFCSQKAGLKCSHYSFPVYKCYMYFFFRILRSKMVLLALLGTVFSAVIQGFIESFLEEYLKIFNLSVTSIGLSFLCKLIILLIVSCRLRPPYKINSQQIGLLTPLYGIFITIFCDTSIKLSKSRFLISYISTCGYKST